jgi:hypothetical protein
MRGEGPAIPYLLFFAPTFALTRLFAYERPRRGTGEIYANQARGSQPSGKGPAGYFRGAVRIDPLQGLRGSARELLHILPPSREVFGRASKPQSHYIYRSPGLKTHQFQDVNGTMLVEIRSTSSPSSSL